MKRILALALVVVAGLALGVGLTRRQPAPRRALPMPPASVGHESTPPPQSGDLAAAFPGILFLHGPRGSNAVALSFDDGPDNRYTPRILAILQRFGVRATFFVVGRNVAAYPAMARRLVAAGEVLGNHTWDHPNLTRLDAAGVRREVQRTAAEVKQVTGRNWPLLRPPYGALNAAVLDELNGMGYKVIYWSVDSRDWQGLSAARVEANVLDHLRRGDIILQHSYSGGPSENLRGTVQALPDIISAIRRRGLRLVTVPQLLGLAATEPPPAAPSPAAAGRR